MNIPSHVLLATAGEDPPVDRLRAAMRLIDNHTAVVRFAARGCGSEGRRPVSAPLSDPTAKPGERYLPDVDAGAPSPGETTLAPPCAQCAGISCWISCSVNEGCRADGLLCDVFVKPKAQQYLITAAQGPSVMCSTQVCIKQENMCPLAESEHQRRVAACGACPADGCRGKAAFGCRSVDGGRGSQHER